MKDVLQVCDQKRDVRLVRATVVLPPWKAVEGQARGERGGNLTRAEEFLSSHSEKRPRCQQRKIVITGARDLRKEGRLLSEKMEDQGTHPRFYLCERPD